MAALPAASYGYSNKIKERRKQNIIAISLSCFICKNDLAIAMSEPGIGAEGMSAWKQCLATWSRPDLSLFRQEAT